MAEEREHSIFRKKSTEYIDSPEKLDHYLHVTTPGVWALLLAVFFCWSVFASGERQGSLKRMRRWQSSRRTGDAWHIFPRIYWIQW